MKKRREFIRTTSAVVLALGIAPVATAVTPRRLVGPGRIVPLANLHCSDFSELLATSFYVREASGARLPLLLAEAQDLSSRFGGENFSLLFRGPPDRPLKQGTYQFEHRELGAFGMFIVPMLGDGRNEFYEAAFNRIVQDD
jgi:hypothetical protein